ncbi:MAG: TolC family protein [Sulfurimonas sp.]|nr:TolC family protein [Sulfurimonas sp.]MDQ7061387.1 TolC family protein [Sulfurimonas sp.]
MKVLTLLTTLLVLSSTTLVANEKASSLNTYLSDKKQEQFNFDYDKNEADASILRDSWIAPILLNYNYTKSNPYTQTQVSESAAIRMDQPIFQSGGIYYGIKFAKYSKKYADYSVDVAKRKLIKDAISILMQIKQKDLQISRQELQIQNSEINLKFKKEQYLNGQLDSGFLDNAIIERNFVIQNLYDIETAKERLISTFSALSDLDYKIATTPHLELLDKEEFLKHNLILKRAGSQIQRDEFAKDVTVAKYLPQVSLTAGYNWTKTDSTVAVFGSPERDYYDYGFRASMPLNINTFRDIESSRIDYLKSKVVSQDKEIELIALFTQVMHNLKNLEKKKLLSLENKEIYSKLLEDTKNLFSAGYKTQYDVDTLENSVNIAQLDAKIYEIDKQVELLSLYEMYVNVQ